MDALKTKKILLGVTGGIAAYKSADLVRRLREVGAEVQVVMTSAAKEFIGPLTFQALSGNPVHLDLLDSSAEAAMGHIELARWADIVVIAPASADFIARLTHGHANDLLSTICLATTAKIVVAPAMNQQMWLNAATQENVQRLIGRGIHLFGPAEGSQACGEHGPGRMLEPQQLLHYLTYLLLPKLFKDEQILVTAGPTHEAIDPVRYISNHSSGKMGFAIAEMASAVGAKVILIAGPTNLVTPFKVERIDVKTAKEMQRAVLKNIINCKILFAAAAVADYRCDSVSRQKIKKNNQDLTLHLSHNPDILASIANLPEPPFTVGFAAETENLISNAKKKLHAKNLDLIVANRVGGKEHGFESDYNEATVLWKDGQRKFPLTTKKKLAYDLMTVIAERYYAKNPT